VHRRQLLYVAALAPWFVYAAEAATLPPATDLQQLAVESARTGSLIVLFFSTPGCPYCAEVRRSYLAPRLAEPRERLLLREVDITSRAHLKDFDGSSTTPWAFAVRHAVRVVPVVMAFDRRGQRIGEALVGLDRSGFYDGYLQNLIDGARQQAGR